MRASSVFGLLAASASTLAAVNAGAQGAPHQRPGLWQTTTAMVGMAQPMTIETCVDAASEASSSVFSSNIRKRDQCTATQITHNLNGSWTAVSTCEFRPGVPTTSRTDITGDFNSKISITLRSPPTAPPKMTMTSVWLGACKPGQHGGDVMMSDGTRMNFVNGAK